MSQKIEFVERVSLGEKIAPLCREYGISRTTGHKLVKRFKEQGYEGLEEQSRRPKRSPLATAEDIVLAVLEARDAHPRWGPEKLEPLLRRRLGELTPSARTIARIWERAHRVNKRTRRRPPSVVERAPQVQAKAPNDVWTVDFKGWWRAHNGQRCEPLTVRDAFSRFVLASTLCRPKTEPVRQVFERLFRKHGVPRAIQCDNGVPFVAVRAMGGLSSLSAWWVSLGIELCRSRPGCPQDNGAHQRMHADMRAEVQAKPAPNLHTQQRLLDKWRQQFNHVRPHQALGGKTPAELYMPSERRSVAMLPPVYLPNCSVARVAHNGCIRYQHDVYFVSTSLRRQLVGGEPLDALRVRLWFYQLNLGTIQIVPSVNPQLLARACSSYNPQHTA